MTKRKAGTAPIPTDARGQITVETVGIEESNPEASVLAAIGAASDSDNAEAEYTVSVYQPPDKKAGETRESWLPVECTIIELPQLRQRLLETYGGGLYRVRVRKDNVMFRAFDLSIKPPPHYVPPSQRVATTAPSSEISTLIQTFAGFMEKTEARMNVLAERITQTKPDAPVNLLRDTIGLVRELLPTPAPAPAPANGLDGMKMFEKGMEFAERMAAPRGGGDGETGLLDIVREVVKSPTVQQLVQGLVANGQQPAPMMRPIGDTAAPRITAPRINGTAAPDARLAEGVAYLVGHARAGAQPNLFTDYVLENVPSTMLDQLERTPDPFAMLAAQFPDVAPHRLWFEALFATLYETVADDLKGDTDVGRAPATATPDRPNA